MLWLEAVAPIATVITTALVGDVRTGTLELLLHAQVLISK